MTIDLIIFEHKLSEPTRIYDLLASGRFADAGNVVHATSVRAAAQAYAAGSSSVLVFNWSESQDKYYALEAILQHAELSAAGVVVIYRAISHGDIEFLREYGLLRNNVALSNNQQLDGEKILAKAKEVSDEASLAWRMRRFFHLSHHGDLAEAERYLTWTLGAELPPIEMAFLYGFIAKARKKFDAAIMHLSRGLKLSQRGPALESRFLYLIGLVEFKRLKLDQATKFMRAAHKASPYNPRRQFMLAQLAKEQGDAASALAGFRQLYNASPEYPGLQARLIELLLRDASSMDEAKDFTTLVQGLSSQKLIAMAKTLRSRKVSPLTSKMAAGMITAFFRHADSYLRDEDYFQAQHIYVHVRKLLPFTTRQEKIEYLYRAAEAYVKLEDRARAAQAIEVLRNGGAKGERLESLLREFRDLPQLSSSLAS